MTEDTAPLPSVSDDDAPIEDEEAPLAPSAEPPARSWRPVGISAATVALLAAVLLFVGIRSLGIWDPYELGLADLGCHNAADHGKFSHATCGAAEAPKGEMRSFMMVQTVAWGFRILGVSESSGRIPLALWVLVGAVAAAFAVGRLVDARAGLFTGAVFVTMPMVLAQGRLILGDAATMGAFSVALSGFAVAAFDRGDEGRATPWMDRAPWFVVGVLGTAAAIGSRGLAIGCAPAAAVGLAWLVRAANADPRDRDPRATLVPVAALVLVVLSVVVAITKLAPRELGHAHFDRMTLRVLFLGPTLGAAVLAALPARPAERVEHFVVGALLVLGAVGLAEGLAVATTSEESTATFIAAVGATTNTVRKFPTFDLHVRQIAHGLFPWSCFIPFAIGRAFAKPSLRGESPAVRREIDLRMAAILAAAIVYAVVALDAPHFGLVPYAAPIALAIIVACSLRDLERTPSYSLAIAIGTAVLVFLVWNDFVFEDLAKTPAELATAPVLEAYTVYGLSIPEELRLKLKTTLALAGAAFLLPIFFVWVDDDPRPGWTSREKALFPLRKLVELWRHPYYGLLLLLLASFEACIAIAGALTWKKALRTKIGVLQALTPQQRDYVVNAWWILLLVAIGAYCAYVGFLYVRDAFRALKRQRVASIAMGGLAAGAIWSFGVMPAVADQFSPMNVFMRYHELGSGAPIALLGINPRTAAYGLQGVEPTTLNDPRTAYEWLMKGDAGRKFLAMRSENLPTINSLYRQKSEPRANLPIVDGRSAQVLLASNVLAGHDNENPLEKMILSAPPTATSDCDKQICAPRHLIDCNIDNKLACVGWDLVDDAGRSVDTVSSGEHVKLRILYRVTAKLGGGWQIFIHVEQPGTAVARKTSDHQPLGGKYGMDLWLPGDVVVDDSAFDLEPNMKSGTPIVIYTGFFTGSSRMPLVSGKDAGPEAEGARLELGRIPVR